MTDIVTITIAPLDQTDLPEADRIFRLAFGTFLGLPDPMAFGGDADFIATRWRTNPAAALGAYSDGTLVGSNFAAQWGTFGYFGPLTVRPDLWGQAIAQRLLGETMALFEQWGTQQAALFTFPNSPKHIGLYQKFGFWPQSLTPLMSKVVDQPPAVGEWLQFSQLTSEEQEARLAQCAALTNGLLPGLDLNREIRSIADQRLGETILLSAGDELAGIAVCHVGKGSEAGSGTTYVKFGAVSPGPDAPASFDRLLAACEALAHQRGAPHVLAGVNTARHAAYRQLMERGFRTAMVGVAMQRPNDPGYNRPDCYAIDDWR